MNTNRREFVRQLSLAFGTILFLPACEGFDSPWRFFTEKESKTLIAFCEQVIPADTDPGATDANIINFIDKQLVGPYTRFQESYRKGIPCIESSSLQLFQKSFHDLDKEMQNRFMLQMEKEELPKEI